MRKILFIVGMFTLLTSFIPKQSKEKRIGYIYVKESNECLTGVRVVSDVDTTYTNFDGYYEIHVKSDTTELQYSLISYNDDGFYVLIPKN